jgi:predicted ABC-type ATPase
MKPLMVVLAGPNGSGKSTLCATPHFSGILKANGVEVINPDEIAMSAPPGLNALIWSGREVHRLVEEMISRTAIPG